MRICATAALAILLLAGCTAPGSADNSAITPGEAAALNDAAAKLDNNAVTPVPEPANGSVAK